MNISYRHKSLFEQNIFLKNLIKAMRICRHVFS